MQHNSTYASSYEIFVFPRLDVKVMGATIIQQLDSVDIRNFQSITTWVFFVEQNETIGLWLPQTHRQRELWKGKNLIILSIYLLAWLTTQANQARPAHQSPGWEIKTWKMDPVWNSNKMTLHDIFCRCCWQDTGKMEAIMLLRCFRNRWLSKEKR